ncbi:hypothetical protein [Methylobacterium sp. sgz302541]|uniref:hypothetical protein n=1 Tax=unclassified Methylobacterium TaxID=2615210 RepID=UPI003D34365B
MIERNEPDPLDLVAEIDDPELRARTARLWGLDHADALARVPPVGDGPHARLLATFQAEAPGVITPVEPDPEIATLLEDLPQVRLCCRLAPAVLHRGLPTTATCEAENETDAEAVTLAHLAEPLAPARTALSETGCLPAEIAIDLVDAVSFLTQEHGLLPNALISVRWEAVGVRDPNRAAGLAHELAAAVGAFVRREFTPDHPDTWVLVHDATAEEGLRTRLLAHVPGWLRTAVRGAMTEALRRLVRKPAGEALVVRLPRRRETAERVAFTWAMVRAMLATLDPAAVRAAGDGQRFQLARLLGVPRLMGTNRLGDVEPVAVAATLGLSARRRARRGFFSAARRGAWHQIATGWELAEFAARTRDWACMHEWLDRLARHPHVDAPVRVYVPRPGQGLVDDPDAPLPDPGRRWPGEHPNALTILYGLDGVVPLREGQSRTLFHGAERVAPIRLGWAGVGDPPEPDPLG